jgi:cytochrome c-type biogenesis protein CcmH
MVKYRLWFIFVLIVVLTLSGTMVLYYRWGARQGLADLRAIETVNQTFSDTLKVPNLSLTALTQLFDTLRHQVRDSAPALARLGDIGLQVGWYEKSAEVFEAASRLNAAQIDYTVQALYAHSLVHEGRLPQDLYIKAMAVSEANPQQFALLNILAIHAYFSEDYVAAMQRWQRLLIEDRQLTAERRRAMEKALDKARARCALTSTTRFRVTLDIAPELRAKVNPTDSIFIAVRAFALDKPPLYVMKCQVMDLPKEVVLDDRYAMIEAPNFSLIPTIEVIAKLSSSQDALASGKTYRISSGEKTVKIGDNRVALTLLNEQGEKDV